MGNRVLWIRRILKNAVVNSSEIAGSVLVVAAVLKLFEIGGDGLSQWMIALAACELFLGGYAMYAGQLRLTKWLLITTYVSFTLYSCIGIWAGYSDCGCAGPVKFSPMFMLCLDLLMSAILLGSLKFRDYSVLGTRLHPLEKASFTGLAACVGLVVGIVFLDTTSAKLGNAVLPDRLNAQIEHDGSAFVEYELHNILGKPISGMVVFTSCGCTTSVLESTSLDVGESVKLQISIEPRVAKAAFRIPFELVYYVNSDRRSDICFLVNEG